LVWESWEVPWRQICKKPAQVGQLVFFIGGGEEEEEEKEEDVET